ncbi:MAG: helix-turn-helix domain-containing protein [Phycisphaeraceae bacterium]|nr:helix-turn-helix domain-containing protein [Phycisphaeraceae bacterium]
MVATYAIGKHPGTVERERELGPLRVTITRYGGRARLARHAHARSQLYFVLEGGFCEFGPWSKVWRTGAAVFHPAGVEHSQEIMAAGARCVNVEIDPEWLGATLGADGAKKLHAARSVGSADGLAARRLANASEAGDARARAEAAGIVLERIARAMGERLSPLAERAAAWMRENWLDGTVAELARALGANPGHVSREFRARYGLSIREQFTRQRLERACGMLEHGARSGEAARACGFADGSHLAHVMMRVMGRTPGSLPRAKQA